MVKTIFKNHLFYPLTLLLLIIPSFVFLLRPGLYWNMHDDMQMIRQLEMEKCIKDGQIPCRWTPDVGYGYGLPMFNYYPPLPYFIGQIFRFSGISFMSSVKYTAVLQIILSALFMYLLASTIFGPMGGLISGLLYTYSPYHAVNIYVRGAMNEAWASVFFPLIFLFSKKLIETEKTPYLFALSLSLTLLLLSHNPMVLMFTPLVTIWSIFWIFVYKYKNNLKILPIISKLCFSIVFALGLSAFFTIPSISETNLVQINKMFVGYYSYYNHFVSIYQLFFRNFWGDGGSIWGPNDTMSFLIGYLHWFIPILITFIVGVKIYLKRKITINEYLVISLIGISFVTAFMAHEKSTFIWKILPILQKVQFPWRFLNLTAFLFSLSSGLLPVLLIKKNKLKLKNIPIFLIIFSLIIILNYKYFTPVTYGPITDEQKFSGMAWINQISGGINDYLPNSAKIAATKPAKEYVDDVSPDKANYVLSGQKKGTDWQFFNIKLDRFANVTLSHLAFPNFTVNVDGKPAKYQIDPLLGRMVINLDAGNHQIYLKLKNTLIRSISNSISLISWLFLLFYFGRILWKKLT